LSLKLKISILHLLVSFITIFFVYMVYDSYIITQEKSLEQQLNKILKLNEQHMGKSLLAINTLTKSKKELTKKVHKYIHSFVEKNTSLELQKLKERVKEKYTFSKQNIDIEIFLLDKHFYVTHSTHAKNIGYNLKLNPKSHNSLLSLKNINQYIHSEDVAVDFLDYELKTYSYSRLSKSKYLGIGIIYKDVIDQKKDFDEMREILNTDMDLLCVLKTTNNQLYYESLIAHKQSYNNTETYFTNIKKFDIANKTDDPVIATYKTWKKQTLKDNNSLFVYIPLLKKENPIIRIPGDIILKVKLNLSEEYIFVQSIIFKLTIFILLHFFLLFIIFYFTTKYQQNQQKLKLQIDKNIHLDNYNKNFISNMVHQIRTPLSIVMSNISLLEMVSKLDISKYTNHINAAINSLSNSYENLSYYMSYKDLHYLKRSLNISQFSIQRIDFLEHIANANGKYILKNIELDIVSLFNDIELERLIDNSLFIAIKYAKYRSNITINLNKIDHFIVLKFIIETKNKNLKGLFKNIHIDNNDISNKKLREFILKQICHKYTIALQCNHKNNITTLQYTWQYIKG